MQKLEIISVVLKRKDSHRYLRKCFESLLELDKYIECTPSVRYQLHGLQKATDPVKLFIFCLNKDDVQERFQIIDGESDIDVDSISLVSLNEVWKQTDRWSPVHCICWYDVRTTDNADEIDNLTYLFLTCIPPSSVSSSVCVLNMADNDYHGRLQKIKEALSSCKIKTKLPNVIPFGRLNGMLNTLLVDRLESVRCNSMCVLDNVKTEVSNMKNIEQREISPQRQHSTVSNLKFLWPSRKEILEVIVNDFPKVDQRLLKRSINSVFKTWFIDRCLKAILLLLSMFCCVKCYVFTVFLFVVILMRLEIFIGRVRFNEKQIVSEYNASLSKLHQKVHLINQLHSDLDYTEKEVTYINGSKTGFINMLKEYFFTFVRQIIIPSLFTRVRDLIK